MTIKSGIGQLYFLDGLDLSGYIGSMEEWSMVDNTIRYATLTDSAYRRLGGKVGGSHRFGHFFEDTATVGILAAVGQMPTGQRIATWVLSGPTPAIGDRALCMVIEQAQQNWTQGADGSFTGVTGGESADFPVENCRMLTAGQDTHASATSNSSFDNGAQASNGAVCYIQFQELDSGTPTFVFEDSANDSSWATLVSMSTTGGASAHAERKTVTGTVERYLRITTTGTFTGADFVACIRVGTADDRLDLS